MGIYQKLFAGKDAKNLVKHPLTANLSERCGYFKDGSNVIVKSKWLADMDWGRFDRHEIPAGFCRGQPSHWLVSATVGAPESCPRKAYR